MFECLSLETKYQDINNKQHIVKGEHTFVKL